LRELRLIARQRQKLVGLLSSEKNRLHKILADGGIRLGVVVSDVHGQSARAMVKALIEGSRRMRYCSLPAGGSRPAAKNCSMPCKAN
jgi:transposase